MDLEDSFAHTIVSSVFKSVFHSESDLVKTDKELVWMLNVLIRNGVQNPVVCAIQLKGCNMKTFKMGLKYHRTYHMIKMSSINLFNNLQGIVALPSVLSSVLQVKVRFGYKYAILKTICSLNH
jgi:hypothetical protein